MDKERNEVRITYLCERTIYMKVFNVRFIEDSPPDSDMKDYFESILEHRKNAPCEIMLLMIDDRIIHEKLIANKVIIE